MCSICTKFQISITPGTLAYLKHVFVDGKIKDVCVTTQGKVICLSEVKRIRRVRGLTIRRIKEQKPDNVLFFSSRSLK